MKLLRTGAAAIFVLMLCAFQSNVPNIFYTDVPDHAWDVILGRPSASSVTASLLAYRDMEGYFELGTESGVYTRQTPVGQFLNGRPVATVIDGLDADTRYYYRFQSRTGTDAFAPGAEFTFHTQRPPGSSFTVTLQADSHLDFNTDPAIYAQALRNALADQPDFHVDLGDTSMTDKYDAYKDSLKQYLAQRYYFGLLCHSAPLFYTIGNHDGEEGRFLNGSADNMAAWSNAMRKLYLPNPRPDGFYTGNDTPDAVAGMLEDYYAWEWGDALFVVLDPFWYTKQGGKGAATGWDWTLGARQYEWLKSTLESSQAKFKLIFIHHLVGGADSQRGGLEAAPLYEWGGHNPDGSDTFAANRPGWEMPIHQLLVANHVSAIFHGHDHLYAKQDLDGIVYQECPQPGYPRYDNATSAASYGYVAGVILGSPGYLRLRFTPQDLTVELVRPVLAASETATRHNGDVAHSYTIQSR